jgi:hypothetical protein
MINVFVYLNIAGGIKFAEDVQIIQTHHKSKILAFVKAHQLIIISKLTPVFNVLLAKF